MGAEGRTVGERRGGRDGERRDRIWETETMLMQKNKQTKKTVLSPSAGGKGPRNALRRQMRTGVSHGESS